MNSTQRLVLALGAASLALAGCSKIGALTAPPVKSGTANFSTFAAMGTSLSAGQESAGLVVTHQTHGFTYLFAQQVGATYTIPSMSADGIPPLLQLVSLNPLIISNQGRTLGAPTNIAQPSAYNDMGVPGALLADATDSTLYDSPSAEHPDVTMFNLIQRNRGNLDDQVASLNPTFISFEYGANEVLGPATLGGVIPPMDAATYAGLLDLTLTDLHAKCPNAKIAICNIPDVVDVPFITTFPPVVLDASGNPVLIGGVPIPLIGSESGSPAPLGLGDYVLLSAADSMAIGTGFPIGTFSYVSGAPGNGRPLTNDEVLSSVEATAISATVDGYNNAIALEAENRGLAVVDFHSLLMQAATTGIKIQGTAYTNEYITGGFFSLDGVHPTDLGYGVLCNAMIDAVDRTFGSDIQHVNLATAASASSSRARPTMNRRLLPDIIGSSKMLAPIQPAKGANYARELQALRLHARR